MKILQTWIKGKLTAVGLSGVVLNKIMEVFNLWPQITETWMANSDKSVGILETVGAAAVLWGTIRKFTKTYQEAN